jgi:hypothetical protein
MTKGFWRPDSLPLDSCGLDEQKSDRMDRSHLEMGTAGRTYRYIAQKLQIGEERARQITAKKERCIAYQVNHGIADNLAALEQQLVVWKRSGLIPRPAKATRRFKEREFSDRIGRDKTSF